MTHSQANMRLKNFFKRSVGLSAGLLAGLAIIPAGSSLTAANPLRVSQLDSYTLDRPDVSRPDASLIAVEAQLSNLTRFPLFLSADQGRLVAASDRFSLTEISQPSLAWIEDQLGYRYGSDRLVEQWRAYRTVGDNGKSLNYVDVIVNQRLWNLLSYYERYSFISQFGISAKSYGYQLRVFNTSDAANARDPRNAGNAGFVLLRGAYICDFSQVSQPPSIETTADTHCEVTSDMLGGRARRN
ncbi:MAG: hypothetical protein WBA76_12540 [Phormidesmis sp.]